MTNHPNPEIERRAVGHWRSIEANAWLIVRSGHGLASEVTSLGAKQSGTFDVDTGAERGAAVRLDVDLQPLVDVCDACRASRLDITTTLTLESTHVTPGTDHRWALGGRLSGPAGAALVDAELEVRDVWRRGGRDEARFVVRTQVPVAALGQCAAHRHAGTEHAELVTHLVATRHAAMHPLDPTALHPQQPATRSNP